MCLCCSLAKGRTQGIQCSWASLPICIMALTFLISWIFLPYLPGSIPQTFIWEMIMYVTQLSMSETWFLSFRGSGLVDLENSYAGAGIIRHQNKLRCQLRMQIPGPRLQHIELDSLVLTHNKVENSRCAVFGWWCWGTTDGMPSKR